MNRSLYKLNTIDQTVAYEKKTTIIIYSQTRWVSKPRIHGRIAWFDDMNLFSPCCETPKTSVVFFRQTHAYNYHRCFSRLHESQYSSNGMRQMTVFFFSSCFCFIFFFFAWFCFVCFCLFYTIV